MHNKRLELIAKSDVWKLETSKRFLRCEMTLVTILNVTDYNVLHSKRVIQTLS
jgi:hypothetical protein